MNPPDALQLAFAAYTAANWEEEDWRQLGRDTGTSDILNVHPRLYRSLSFGDPDYYDAILSVIGPLLREGVAFGTGEKGRMEFIADFVPDLPRWMQDNAPPRPKRLFSKYLAERDVTEIPEPWRTASNLPAAPDSEEKAGLAANDAQKKQIETGRRYVDEYLSRQAPSANTVAPTTPSKFPEQFRAEKAGADNRELATENEIFVVHGHDTRALDSVKLFIHQVTGIMPTALSDKPAKGQTIIEKFEKTGESTSYVVVLLTPDDVGQTADESASELEPRKRARQNVVLEFGYFIGKIGRDRIAVLNAGVEKPSDIEGINYIAYPGINWQFDLLKELQEAGLARPF